MDIITAASALLRITPALWTDLTRSTPNDLLARAPAEGEWSAVDCLQHLIDTERWVFPARVRALRMGQDFPAFDPDSQGTRSDISQAWTELAAEFAQLRGEALAVLATVTEDDLARCGRHAELGMVTLSELLHNWAAHDLMHTVQAERALMQPFIAGCGPWQPYFSDHVAPKAKGD